MRHIILLLAILSIGAVSAFGAVTYERDYVDYCDQAVGCWRFNESESSYVDSSHNNSILKAEGATPDLVSGSQCQESSCFDFDSGSSEYLVGDSVLTHLSTGNFSISFWFSPDVTLNSGSAVSEIMGFSKYPGGTQYEDRIHFDINANSDGKIRILWEASNNGTQSMYTNRTSWTGGERYHMGATCGSGGAELYVNGVSVNSSANTDCSTAMLNYDIGRRPDTANSNFNGKIDEIAVFDFQLTDEQFLDIYTYGLK